MSRLDPIKVFRPYGWRHRRRSGRSRPRALAPRRVAPLESKRQPDPNVLDGEAVSYVLMAFSGIPVLGSLMFALAILMESNRPILHRPRAGVVGKTDPRAFRLTRAPRPRRPRDSGMEVPILLVLGVLLVTTLAIAPIFPDLAV